jgi:hypothetical protein
VRLRSCCVRMELLYKNGEIASGVEGTASIDQQNVSSLPMLFLIRNLNSNPAGGGKLNRFRPSRNRSEKHLSPIFDLEFSLGAERPLHGMGTLGSQGILLCE